MRQWKTHTFESLKMRCIECGDCWIFQSSSKTEHGKRYPQVNHNGRGTQVRRLLFVLSGRELSRPILLPNCGNRFCVNPDHMIQLYEPQKGKIAAARGSFSKIARRVSIAQARRNSKTAKVTMEIAREIRISEEAAPSLAVKYGISRSTVSAIRRGDRWAEFDNPFVGLMR